MSGDHRRISVPFSSYSPNGDRSESTQTETLLAAPFNPLLSTHFRGTAGPGQLFWQLTPAASENGIIVKSGMAQHVEESLTNAVYVCRLSVYITWSVRIDQQTSVTANVLVRKYADSKELGSWLLFLQQSAHHCFNHKPRRINPQWHYCRVECGLLSHWLTVIIIEKERTEVLSNAQKPSNMPLRMGCYQDVFWINTWLTKDSFYHSHHLFSLSFVFVQGPY